MKMAKKRKSVKTALEKKWERDIRGHKSAYVETDIAELELGRPGRDPARHARLDPKEAVAQKRQECLDDAANYRIAGQDEFEDATRSEGPRLHYKEVIRRLQLCNPAIQVKSSDNTKFGDNVALYIPKKPHEFSRSDWAVKNGALPAPPKGMFFIDYKYIGGMPKDWLPEWGHGELDTSYLVSSIAWGWRSILSALIKARVITYQDGVKHFGDPRFDPRSTLWFEQLQQYMPI